jgi:hypothetical protein
LRLARSSIGVLAGIVRVVVVRSGGSRKRTERTERTERLKERTWVVREEPRTHTPGARLITFQAADG